MMTNLANLKEDHIVGQQARKINWMILIIKAQHLRLKNVIEKRVERMKNQ